MQVVRIPVTHPVGLHARPASLFVKTASQFDSEILVCNISLGGAPIDAKSIISVLTLGVQQNHEIEISTDGVDEIQALQRLRELVESDFNGVA